MDVVNPPPFCHAAFRGRIGVARADITPPAGIFFRNWGAAKHDVAASIHRPLTLSALMLSPCSGGPTLVLVEIDTVGWRSVQVFRDFHQRLAEALDIAPNRLIVAVSHSHSAPPLMEADLTLAGGGLHRQWMEHVFASAVATARQALAAPFLGTLDWQIGSCSLATSRDLPLGNTIACGYSPAGETDDTLLVGRITDDAGRLRGVMVNYGCHPTSLAWENTAVSPDYIGAMRDTVQQETGVPTFFLLGACGELAPRYQYVGNPDIADRHGKQLGFAALSTLYSMEPAGTQLVFDRVLESGAPLALWKHTASEPSQILRSFESAVELPIKDWPTSGELEHQRQACTDRTMEERLRRKRNVRRDVGDGATYHLPIHAWRIGDAVLIGTCCEAYSIAQKELRRRFPDNAILCLNLINGAIAYLPPAELYDTDVYPTWQTPFDRGCLELTIERMSEAVRDVLAD